MIQTTPAPVKGPESLSKLGGTNNTRKLKGNNSLKTLERSARKWASRGYYPTPSAAMEALLGDSL